MRLTHRIAIIAAALAIPVGGVAQAAATTDASATPAEPGAAVVQAEVPRLTATVDRTLSSADANQGIAVDKHHVYTVNNRTITKHDKRSGKALLQFVGDPSGPIEHLDSGVVVGSRLYAAHSNWPRWPMTSSIEVFDTRTMQHVGTHSFGIDVGSLTWLDYHDGAWWVGFANYDRVQPGMSWPYGETNRTTIVKLDRDLRIGQRWTLPQGILDASRPMSNSGGSWGPDGKLYLTGHDNAEAYVVQLPRAGSTLEWLAIVSLPGIQGQGIAWDRSQPSDPRLWAISRPNRLALDRVPWGGGL